VGGLKSAINIRMLEGLRAAAIDIPYPQRVVHLRAIPPLASGEVTVLAHPDHGGKIGPR